MDEEAREGGSRWDPVFHSKEGFKLGGEEGRGRGRDGWRESRSEQWLGALAPAVGCLGSHPALPWPPTGGVASVSHFSHLYNGDTSGAYFIGLL